MEILDMILSIVTGVAACIPLVIQLVKYIKELAKSKNWTVMMQMVLKLMAEAETNFKEGAEKKEYVLDSVKALESTLNYDVDIDKVGAMIDSIVEATKKINTK
jgi:aryl-alcohol dehydrogenase-like predicted oxidoreductase